MHCPGRAGLLSFNGIREQKGTTMKLVAGMALAGVLLLASGAHAAGAATAPDALVRSTVDEVLAVIKKTKDPKALVELAEKKVVTHFDFRTMTRLAMGRSWAQANSAQQQALERAFRTLLVRTYTTALSQTTAESKVDVRPVTMKPGDTEVVVTTFASEAGRKPIQIDYRMARTDGSWKVYDVVVENLSLVINYRGSFQSEISRSGIDGLIRTIEEKNKKLAEG
ncbi:MAG: ABC transporter substrate-binding protein [Betaproteobacteria bacterium]|nr:ABC transporter substrate-binding protein [Betaproteobacteria bacterium]